MSDAGEGLEDDEEIESGSDVVLDPEQAQEPAPKTKKAKTAKTKKKRKADPDAGAQTFGEAQERPMPPRLLPDSSVPPVPLSLSSLHTSLRF